MKKFLCLALCMVMLLSTIALSACNNFYTGDEIATQEDRQKLQDFCLSFKESKMPKIRQDMSLVYTNNANPQSSFVMEGNYLATRTEDSMVEYYKINYVSQSATFTVQAWCSGSDFYFVEEYQFGDSPRAKNTFCQKSTDFGYTFDMSAVSVNFSNLSAISFFGKLVNQPLYGKNNKFYVVQQYLEIPLIYQINVSQNSYTSQRLVAYTCEDFSVMSREVLKKTTQTARMPNVNNVAEGRLNAKVLDVLLKASANG